MEKSLSPKLKSLLRGIWNILPPPELPLQAQTFPDSDLLTITLITNRMSPVSVKVRSVFEREATA